MSQQSLWNRVRRLARIFTAIRKQQKDNQRRLGELLIKESSNPGVVGYVPGGDEDGGGDGGVLHNINLFRSCFGNYATDGDVYLYMFDASGAYYLFSVATTNGGHLQLFVPDYPLVYDHSDVPAPIVPKIVVAVSPYSGYGSANSFFFETIYVPRNVTVHNVTIFPSGGLLYLPAVYVIGSGSGASITTNAASNGVPSYVIQTKGDGYGLDTVIRFDGYYGTGLQADPVMGYLVGTVTAGGSGYTFIPTLTIAPGGSAPTISATVTNSGLASWSIVDPGAGLSSPPTFSIPGPAPLPTSGFRAATIQGVVSGGSLSGILVNDPGLGYTDGKVVTIAGVGGRGSHTSAGVSTSAGSLLAVNILGSAGYIVPPSVSLTGGGGSGGAISVDVHMGVTGVRTTRKADTWSCFGRCTFPMKLTGWLSNQFGTVLMKPDVVVSGGVSRNAILATQWGLGKMLQFTPRIPFPTPHYYPFTWELVFGGYLSWRAVWVGGSLDSIIIDNPGYGNTYGTIMPDPRRSGNPFYAGCPFAAYDPTSYAIFSFTFNSDGGAVGYTITAAGSGYKTAPVGSLLNGTTAPIAGPRPQAGEYELNVVVPSFKNTLVGGDNAYYPAVSGGAFSAQVRASSYVCSPFTAYYDFTGTFADGVLFQSGSRNVIFDGS